MLLDNERVDNIDRKSDSGDAVIQNLNAWLKARLQPGYRYRFI